MPKFNTIYELINFVNANKDKIPEFDCACFAYLVKKSFPDAKIRYVKYPHTFHFEVELHEKVYDKPNSQDAGLVTVPDSYERFPAEIAPSSEGSEHYVKDGKHYLNEIIVKSKLTKLFNMKDSLKEIKLQLHDAPSEVKEAFNNVIEYFSSGGKRNREKAIQEWKRALKISEDALKLLDNKDAINCILSNGDPYIWDENEEHINKIKETLMHKIEHFRKLLNN